MSAPSAHAGPAHQTFLVERYLPGLTVDTAGRDVRGVLRACAALTRGGRSVRYVGTIVIPVEETEFSIFEADDAAWVAEAQRRAGLPFDRIVRALEFRERVGQQAAAAGAAGSHPRTARSTSAGRRSS